MVYWNIWIDNTLHAYVLGEHTIMKNELYIVYRPLLKVRGLSIEPRFSTRCIDLSIHVHVLSIEPRFSTRCIDLSIHVHVVKD